MQSTAGTDLVAISNGEDFIPVARVKFAWDGAVFIDESSHLLSASGQMDIASSRIGRTASGVGVYQKWTITLENNDGRFSPTNAASPLFVDISANKTMGTPVTLEVGFHNLVSVPEYLTQFVGFIDQPTAITANQPTITFSCIGREYTLLEHRARIPVTQDQTVDEWMEILTDLANLPSTSFDLGIFHIPFLWMAEDAIWKDCQTAAASENGFFYLDKEGNAIFENAWHWLIDPDHAVAVESWAESDYLSVSLGFEQKEVYNTVDVIYKPRIPGPSAKVFELAEEWSIPPSTTLVFKARLRRPVLAPLDVPVSGTDFIGVTVGGVDKSSDLVVTVVLYSQEADVTIQNTNATYEIYLRQFTLEGVSLINTGQQKSPADSVDSSIGDPTLDPTDPDFKQIKRFEFDGGEYMQTKGQADFSASIIAERSKNPRVTVTIAGLIARPYLEVGDRINVTATQQGFVGDIFVTSIAYKVGPGVSYMMDIVGVEAAGYFSYTKAEYFILGTDTVNDTNRIFH